MRQRSKSKATLDKADRALQDYYRQKFPNEKCESCGNPFSLMHHLIEKSKSNFLRFNPINLIFLCKKCHSAHHCFGDATVHLRIILKKGIEWLKEIMKLKMIQKQYYVKKELEEIIKKYVL